MDLRKNSCSSVNLKSITPSSPEVLPTACSDLLLRSPHRSEAPPTPDLPSPALPHICHRYVRRASEGRTWCLHACLLYTSDAADDLLCVDLGGRRIIKKKKTK